MHAWALLSVIAYGLAGPDWIDEEVRYCLTEKWESLICWCLTSSSVSSPGFPGVVVTNMLGHRPRISLGSRNRLSGSNLVVDARSTVAISASSSMLNGRVE